MKMKRLFGVPGILSRLSVYFRRNNVKGFFNLFKRSALEFKNMRSLIVTAMLIALDLALKLAADIVITEDMKISFAFVALASIGMLYGPTMGFAAGVITDLLGFMIKPSGAFDIRFTLIEALGAMLYGLFLYNAQNDRWLVPRVIAAKTTVVVVCNFWLTTWALSSLMGRGFLALFPARAVKSIIQLPIDIVLLAVLLPAILKVYQLVFKNARKVDEKLLFADENVGKAMMTLIGLVMVIVFGLGIFAQSLNEKHTDLKGTVKEQGERIAQLEEEIAAIYDELGIELSSSEE